MKFRAEAIGLIVDNRPVGAYFNDPLKAKQWANSIANDHKCLVRIYQTYERVLMTIKPIKARALKEDKRPYGRLPGCTCATRVFCIVHPEKGRQ